MRRNVILIFVAAAVVFGLATSTISRAKAEEDLKKELLKVSDDREKALAAGDVAALDRIDSDDLVYTNWRGVTLTKAQHQADVKTRNISFQTNFRHSDVQVVVHGDTGIVTGESATNVTYKGAVMNGTRKFVNVFVKENGAWRCVVHFETPVAQ